MKNASRIARLLRMSNVLPPGPDANITFICVMRTTPEETASGYCPEMTVAHVRRRAISLADSSSLDNFTREADESEREFLDRVRAAVRPYAKRQRVNVVAYSAN